MCVFARSYNLTELENRIIIFDFDVTLSMYKVLESKTQKLTYPYWSINILRKRLFLSTTARNKFLFALFGP